MDSFEPPTASLHTTTTSSSSSNPRPVHLLHEQHQQHALSAPVLPSQYRVALETGLPAPAPVSEEYVELLAAGAGPSALQSLKEARTSSDGVSAPVTPFLASSHHSAHQHDTLPDAFMHPPTGAGMHAIADASTATSVPPDSAIGSAPASLHPSPLLGQDAAPSNPPPAATYSDLAGPRAYHAEAVNSAQQRHTSPGTLPLLTLSRMEEDPTPAELQAAGRAPPTFNTIDPYGAHAPSEPQSHDPSPAASARRSLSRASSSATTTVSNRAASAAAAAQRTSALRSTMTEASTSTASAVVLTERAAGLVQEAGGEVDAFVSAVKNAISASAVVAANNNNSSSSDAHPSSSSGASGEDDASNAQAQPSSSSSLGQSEVLGDMVHNMEIAARQLLAKLSVSAQELKKLSEEELLPQAHAVAQAASMVNSDSVASSLSTGESGVSEASLEEQPDNVPTTLGMSAADIAMSMPMPMSISAPMNALPPLTRGGTDRDARHSDDLDDIFINVARIPPHALASSTTTTPLPPKTPDGAVSQSAFYHAMHQPPDLAYAQHLAQYSMDDGLNDTSMQMPYSHAHAYSHAHLGWDLPGEAPHLGSVRSQSMGVLPPFQHPAASSYAAAGGGGWGRRSSGTLEQMPATVASTGFYDRMPPAAYPQPHSAAPPLIGIAPHHLHMPASGGGGGSHHGAHQAGSSMLSAHHSGVPTASPVDLMRTGRSYSHPNFGQPAPPVFRSTSSMLAAQQQSHPATAAAVSVPVQSDGTATKSLTSKVRRKSSSNGPKRPSLSLEPKPVPPLVKEILPSDKRYRNRTLLVSA